MVGMKVSKWQLHTKELKFILYLINTVRGWRRAVALAHHIHHRTPYMEKSKNVTQSERKRNHRRYDGEKERQRL